MKYVIDRDLGRPKDTRDVRNRIFIACEGYRTEVDYFTELVRRSKGLGIRGMVEVIVMNRHDRDVGLSDPARVLELMRDHMDFLSTGRCSLGLFAGVVADAAGKDNVDAASAVLSDPRFTVLVEGGFITDIDRAKDVASMILLENGIRVPIVMHRQQYRPETDMVCIVVDRDAGDERDSARYARFLDGCASTGYMPIVTNPMFELWILMHEPDASGDMEAVRTSRNPAATLKKRMKERGLDKRRLDHPSIVKRIGTAMANSEGFVHTPRELESEVGTNVPVLIRMMGYTG